MKNRLKITIINSVVISLLFLIFVQDVSAMTVSSSISGTTTISQGSNLVLTFNLNTSEAAGGFSAKIEHDSRYLTIDTYESLSSIPIISFNKSTGSFNAASSDKSIIGSTAVVRVVFKPTSAFTPGTSTPVRFTDIKVSNVSGTGTPTTGTTSSVNVNVAVPKSTNNNLSALSVDGTSVSGFSAGTVTYNLGNTNASSISIGATAQDAKATVSGTGTKNLSYGANSFKVTVTAESGAKKDYTINITRNDPRSTNNYLSSLTVSSGTLNFNRTTNSYTVIVENDVTSVTIGASVEDSKSSVSGTGAKTINVYENRFSVVVTAENGSRRTYAINIVRKDSDGFLGNVSRDNKLESLTVEGYDIEFDPEKLTYELFVDLLIEELSISAKQSDAKATLTVPESLILEVGSNELIFEVVAESGEVRQYVITVVRSDKAPLLSQNQTMDVFDRLASDEIWLSLSQNERISDELLTKIKENGKNLVLVIKDEATSFIYQYFIANRDIDGFMKDSYELTFTSDQPEKFKELTNHAMGITLNFRHQGDYQKLRTLILDVSSQYANDEVLMLYYFDQQNERFVLISEEVKVVDGKVSIEFASASEYFLTRSNLQTNSSFDLFDPQYLPYIVLGEFLVILILLLLLLTKPKKRRFKPID